MSISTLYNDLGAPLRNIRWSWGAVNPHTHSIFLSVWEDERKKLNDQIDTVRVTAYAQLDPRTDLGFRERINQVDEIISGRRAFLIFCRARSIMDRRRSLAIINSTQLFPVISAFKIDHDVYLQYGTPTNISEFFFSSKNMTFDQ